MSRRSALVSMAVATTAITVAGCGDTRIDGTKVAAHLRSSLTPPPRAVSCPSGARPHSGSALICRLSYADGDAGQITVHELDGAGHVEASPGDLVILSIGRHHAEHALLQLLQRNHVGVRQSVCPANSPAQAGTVTCRVVDIHRVRATVTEHIGPGGALVINPATDLHVQVPHAG
jgi:hypothetical protein